MTDIFNAVMSGEIKQVEAVLNENPAFINQQDRFGRIPAIYPAMRGDFTMLEFLSKQSGFDATIEDYEGKSLLEATFWSNDIEMARYAFSLMYPIDPPSPNAPVI